LKISELNGPLQKKKKKQPKSTPQLIHMTLQGGLVIKDIYNKIIHEVRKTTLEPSI
jgi:hypothetical protein